MTRGTRWFGLVALFGLLVLCLGCKVRGGGHLPGLDGGKATFAVNGTLHPDLTIAGAGEYHDHSVNVDAHLRVEECDDIDLDAFEEFVLECLEEFDVDEGEVGIVLGCYTPQPKKLGDGGCFAAFVVDVGEPGGNGDFIAIMFFGGVYDGYANCGIISGGNIQVKFPD
jgi:hypothetical protein